MAKAKKLASGSWRCLVYDSTENTLDEKGNIVYGEDGKPKPHRIYQSFTSYDPSSSGKRAAEFAAAEFALNKKDKKVSENTMAVGEALKSYRKLKSNVLSQTTLRGYRSLEKNQFTDIKDIELNLLTAPILQNWINKLSATLAPKTVRNANGLLTAVLETYAPDIRHKVQLPQKQKPNLYVPSDGDIKVLMDYFSDNDKDMLIAIYMAAFGTLRRSEVCALTSNDISGRVVSINKAMVMALDNSWIIKTTKNVSSTRFVKMPQFVIDMLPKKGRLININPSTITDRFIRALEKLDIPKFRYHDLRHYAASIMHAIGIPDVYIMQRGGWSSDATLKQIYRGAIEDYQEKFTDKTIDHFETMQHEIQHKKNNP